jgi:hypothetical protein
VRRDRKKNSQHDYQSHKRRAQYRQALFDCADFADDTCQDRERSRHAESFSLRARKNKKAANAPNVQSSYAEGVKDAGLLKVYGLGALQKAAIKQRSQRPGVSFDAP